MNKKCEKFESLFIFSDEETLKNHVAECDDCKAELEKMEKISDLIKEVRPHYKKNRFDAVRVACVLFAFVISGLTFKVVDANYNLIDTVMYGSELSAEEIGFMTDDYGLIMVDE